MLSHFTASTAASLTWWLSLSGSVCFRHSLKSAMIFNLRKSSSCPNRGPLLRPWWPPLLMLFAPHRRRPRSVLRHQPSMRLLWFRRSQTTRTGTSATTTACRPCSLPRTHGTAHCSFGPLLQPPALVVLICSALVQGRLNLDPLLQRRSKRSSPTGPFYYSHTSQGYGAPPQASVHLRPASVPWRRSNSTALPPRRVLYGTSMRWPMASTP
jgi:hypothetical protein